MVDAIINQIIIWLPSLASILGIITTAKIAVEKIYASINQLKSDANIQRLKSDLERSIAENKEIKEELDLLLDEIHKIKNYREATKK